MPRIKLQSAANRQANEFGTRWFDSAFDLQVLRFVLKNTSGIRCRTAKKPQPTAFFCLKTVSEIALGGFFVNVVLAKCSSFHRFNGSTLENMILNSFHFILAQAGQAAGQPGVNAPNPTGEMVKMLGMIAVFGVLMWVMMIRPQQKKAKEHAALLTGLRPGDKIITTSGIIGVVVTIKEKSVSIRSADTKLEILKSAVADITERGADSSEAKS